jgi:pyridoxine kinase
MVAVTLIATMDPNNNWSHNVFPLDENALRAQMETIFKGASVDAVKSGMLGTFYAVDLTKEYIESYKIKNYVLDPVMICKGGGEVLHSELNTAIEEKLLPLARIVTPNLFEAAQLSGLKEVDSVEKMKEAARIIKDKGAENIFVKGGAKLSNATKSIDLFYDGKNFEIVEADLVKTDWNHGAGCTTAAAITAGLAQGLSVYDAVKTAKQFITKSLQSSFALNKWVGPGNPSAWRKDTYFKAN